MDKILVWRNNVQQFYAKYSQYIHSILRFVLAFVILEVINHEIGFIKEFTSPVTVIVASVICTLLPVSGTTALAAVVVLIQIFSVSKAASGVTLLVFLIFFIFYLKFSPNMSFMILITVISLAFKIPYIVPIICGLAGNMSWMVPVSAGIFTVSMMEYVKGIASAGMASQGLIQDLSVSVRSTMSNKEMWIIFITVFLSTLTVYLVHRMMIENAWNIAMAGGVAVNVIIPLIGNVAFKLHISYLGIIVGNLLAVAIALVFELFFFYVDYSHGEDLRFEDDDYYYYVKAVPKIVKEKPDKSKKTVKFPHISKAEHQELKEMEEEQLNALEEEEEKTEASVSVNPDEERQNLEQTIVITEPEKFSQVQDLTVAETTPQAKTSEITDKIDCALLTQNLRNEFKKNEDEMK